MTQKLLDCLCGNSLPGRFHEVYIMQLDILSTNWKAFIKVKKESQISTSYNHLRQCVVMKWRPKVDGLPLQLSSTQVLDASGCCLKYATTCSKSCRLSTFVSFFLACFPCPKQSASRSDSVQGIGRRQIPFLSFL